MRANALSPPIRGEPARGLFLQCGGAVETGGPPAGRRFVTGAGPLPSTHSRRNPALWLAEGARQPTLAVVLTRKMDNC
jgi:hypothetical protein